MNWVAIVVFVLLFGGVTVLGFLAARWRRGDLDQLNEWGLAGRRLGTLSFGSCSVGTFTLPILLSQSPP